MMVLSTCEPFMSFFVSNWKAIIAFTTLIFSTWKYFDTKKAELAWKRTAFLFEQMKLLDTNPSLTNAIKILESDNAKQQIQDMIENDADTLHEFEKLLNFLDRLAYATLYLRTLTLKEMKNFESYIEDIYGNDMLKEYCNNYGFEDVINIYPLLRDTRLTIKNSY